MSVVPGTKRLHDALDSFLEAREGARKFHGVVIGKDVNPQFCLADWLCLARAGQREVIEKKYFAEVEKSILVEESGTSGGYLVPPSLSDGMMRDLSTGSLMRKWGAFVQPMKTQQCQLPLPDVSTAQVSGTAPYFGGFLMQIESAQSNFGQTAGMQFRSVTLTAWTLGGYVYASNPFLMDSVGVESWLTHLFGRGAAWYQDWYFFQGAGVGEPIGIINGGAQVTVTRGSGGSISTTDAQNMVNKFLPSAWESGACWFAHPTTLAKITAFTGWFPNGELMLYGLPIVPTGKCSTLGSQGDLILACPSLYIIGERMNFEIAFGPEEPTAWKNNQSAFRVLSRVDGQPATAAPITLSDGSSQVSPFVVLK